MVEVLGYSVECLREGQKQVRMDGGEVEVEESFSNAN